MKILFLIILTLNFELMAREFPVVVRSPKFRAIIKPMNLTNLESTSSFDGTYFKIVNGTSSSAIPFESDPELVLKAATTYYHLSLARDYFVNKVNSEKVKNLKKMTIRIDLTREFFELGPFANVNKPPVYNTAITIPAGAGFPSRGVAPWDMEIWFRPKKVTHIDELNLRTNIGQIDTLFGIFREQVHMMSFQRFMAGLIGQTINKSNPNSLPSELFWQNSMRIAGTSLLMELFYQFRDPLTKLTSRKHFWLETALIPEVIYHEFAHVALSDHLALSHESPVVEGLADIFAVMISGGSKIATNIKKYNTFSGKNAKRKQDYQIQFENSNYGNADYVLGLLWNVKEVVGETLAPKFMQVLSTKLNSSSSVRNQLVKGIRETCEEICPNPSSQNLEILKIFAKKKM